MEKLQARMVLEILGRPAEHIKNSLSLLLEKLEKEKGVKLIEKKINDPIYVKDSKDLFTTFGEVILELDSLDVYFGLIFAYMPANMEILTPEKITLRNDEISILANRLLTRLHDYDALAKRIVHERNFLLQKLREVAPHMFKSHAKENNPKMEEETKSKKTRIKKSKIKKSKKSS